MTTCLALTPGDPAGIGPEITLQFLKELPEGGVRPVVFGDKRLLDRAASWVKADLMFRAVRDARGATNLGPEEIGLWHVPWIEPQLPAVGQVDAACGDYAYRVLETVAPLLVSKELSGVVTGPISKEAIQCRRPAFIGHTEFFAQSAQVDRFGMLLVVEPLRAIHVTTHVPIADVPALLTPERILATLDLAARSQAMFGDPDGVIAVCGLNPHSGEAGKFGREEITAIIPAMDQFRARGARLVGPLPPDTVFSRALRGEFQQIVCMYHDQGHIALKTLGFDRGINVTVGLPFIRTSVDHGTAFDLAGKGTASVGSLRAAWNLATKLLSHA